MYRNPECLEEAIYRCRAFLRILSTDDLVLCRIAEVLADLMTMRSDLASLEVFKKHVPTMQRSPTSHHSHSLLLLFAPLTRLAGSIEPEEMLQHLQVLNPSNIRYTTDVQRSGRPPSIVNILAAIALGEVLFHSLKCSAKLNTSTNQLRLYQPFWRPEGR
jgi:hypothetical protein